MQISAQDDVLRGTPYQTVQFIGSGGMGDVLLVRHRTTAVEMVVKVLRPELASSPQLGERLRLEARALAALEHPHIVRVLGSGETVDQRPFLVLERLQGATLDEELRAGGPPPLAQALGDVIEVLRGLSAAHALGMVHRDIKPSNVFAHHDAERGRVMKLLDFGVVKVLGDRGPAPLAAKTSEGLTLGTPRFMSPEQARAGSIDARSDLYSVGLLLYQLVCGRGPFDECDSELDMLAAHLRGAVPRPSWFAAHTLPAELDGVILKALAKERPKRFQTADHFAVALKGILGSLEPVADWQKSSLVAPSEPRDATRPLLGTELLGGVAGGTLRMDGGPRSESLALVGRAESPPRPGPSRAVLVLLFVLVATAGGWLVALGID